MPTAQLIAPPARPAGARTVEPWGTLARVERGPDEADAPRSAESLLSDVARGDDSAFAVLYDTLGRGVFGTCLGVLRDPDHAAEVAQEVWVEVWRTAARFDAGRGSARTWTLTLAHRRAVDRVRAVQAQRDRDQRVLDGSAEREFDVVADEVESALEQVRVRDCLGILTPTQKQAVVLAYYGGRTYREVADELAAPLPTVKTRIRDGLIRLRDCLGVTS
ncbi:ECF RNA polymerase sigma factor SigK [Cellulomonas terrae]|uniref:RNA polymerase sigma factor SigK n=1 Tax=Cellulomonas terrae TaxID=311234 RepID=A0A511JKG5_9CELL|nr:ECF RNA polymerase sigma factor SigK [Cellulomonas terrae]GEL98501.1 RNA polymerase sigma factor SigK [Cellulomonas terrae]